MQISLETCTSRPKAIGKINYAYKFHWLQDSFYYMKMASEIVCMYPMFKIEDQNEMSDFLMAFSGN